MDGVTNPSCATGDQSPEADLSGVPVTITLVVADWRAILTHLQVGAFQTVAPLISAINTQAMAQLEAVQKACAQMNAECAAQLSADERVH
jgi:hypothetical protein